MGRALQVLTGFATNPGAAITALTASTGDSFAVDDFPATDHAVLANVWAQDAAGGVLRIRSPRLHDPAQGIRLQIPAGDDLNLLGLHTHQRIYPADNLIVELSGGGAEVDIASLLVYYDNLPGIDAPLVSYHEIVDRIVNIAGVEIDLVSGAVAGQYGGARTLNQDFQNLRADEHYALLGYTCASRFATLRITGPDTGKVGLGGPGSVRTEDTATWFKDLSDKLEKPCIPIIKANNQGGTVIDLVDAAVTTSHHVSLILGELAGR